MEQVAILALGKMFEAMFTGTPQESKEAEVKILKNHEERLQASEAKVKALETQLAKKEARLEKLENWHWDMTHEPPAEHFRLLDVEAKLAKLEPANTTALQAQVTTLEATTGRLESLLFINMGVSLVLAAALVVALLKRRSDRPPDEARKKADRPLGVTRL